MTPNCFIRAEAHSARQCISESFVQTTGQQPSSRSQDYSIPRERMVERLRDHYHIRDPKVLEAMRLVPRHAFVPDALQTRAYGDHALPISGSQTISQPYIVARMTELLEITSESRVMEIGAGSGYQTAILATIAGQVYAMEPTAKAGRYPCDKAPRLRRGF